MDIAVTGVGVVSALGGDPPAFAAALRAGLNPCTLREFARMDGSRVMAPACLAVTAEPAGLIEPRKLRRMFRLARMAAVAARQAVNMAGLDMAALNPSRVGVVFGTSFGALETTQKFLDSYLDNGERAASPLQFMNSVHGVLASQVAMDLGATGVNLTVSQHDISFEAALAQGARAIEEDRADCVLVGGADELTPMLHEFGSRVLLFSLDAADCAPDVKARRPAVVPGDGAAVLLLQRAGAKPLARLRAARVGRCDHNGRDVALQALQDAGVNAPGLVTNGRNGSARAARLFERRERLLREKAGAAAFASQRWAFGEYPTAGAQQAVASVLMLAGREPLGLPAVAGAPATILHDGASTSGGHGAYVLAASP